jgi:hypothetical protein
MLARARRSLVAAAAALALLVGAGTAAAQGAADEAELHFRLTLEAPRRIDGSSSADTRAALLGDVTISGNIKPIGLRYVVGVYNVADVHYALPVVDSFKSATMPQNGRTFLIDLLATYP